MSLPHYRSLGGSPPAKRRPPPADLVGKDAFLKLFRQLTHRHRPDRVFTEFVEMAAIALSNKWDLQQAPGREERYLQLIKPYAGLEERFVFPKLMASLTLTLDRDGYQDFFGAIWSELELGSSWAGQVFSPFHVAELMAEMTFTDVKDVIDAKGFASIYEPACGAGVMVVAAAKALSGQGFDPTTCMHAFATDIDPRCVHMTYLSLSLLRIPAIVTLGDSLNMTQSEYWLTPAHIEGGWSARLRSPANLSVRRSAPSELELQEQEALRLAPPVPAANPEGFGEQAADTSGALSLRD